MVTLAERYDTETPVEAWHEKTRRFYEYWRSIHPAEGLPGRQHFDPAAIFDLMPMVWIADVQREPLRFRYRLVGTAATQVFRKELTGRWFDEAHSDFVPAAPNYGEYKRAVETGAPVCSHGRPILNYEPSYTKRERVILPLARDGRTVDMVLCRMVVFGVDGRELA
jgi:hypothetical protein